MNNGTVVAIVIGTVILVLLAVMNQRAQRKEARLRQGRPKRREGDPPWKEP